jgi:DNA-binding transcriptional ArsR family regulator
LSEHVQKQKILDELEKVHPCDLSIGEVAKVADMSDITASKYLSVLKAEGKVEISRKVGKAVFFRLKKEIVAHRADCFARLF